MVRFSLEVYDGNIKRDLSEGSKDRRSTRPIHKEFLLWDEVKNNHNTYYPRVSFTPYNSLKRLLRFYFAG